MKTPTRFLIALGAVMALLLSAARLAAADAPPPKAPGLPQRIASIDLKKVFDEFFKTKIADAEIREEAAGLDKSAKELADREQSLIGEYKKALEDSTNQALAEAERDKRKKAAEGTLVEINAVQMQMKSFDRSARSTLSEKQLRFREKILKEIQLVVNTRAKAGGYAFVINSAAEDAGRTPVIFFNSGEDDLTATVIKELNANAPADLPKANGKPEDKK